MISRLRGKLLTKEENRVVVDVGGICYEIHIPHTVYNRLVLHQHNDLELVIYHYYTIEKNRSIPVMIGFIDELEKDFFEKFISVSGVGPRVALKAFDKPIALIAQAIEEGDIDFLKTLDGIGAQKAKQIIAYLQGKVGRFALIKEEVSKEPVRKEIVEEAKGILRRLQYHAKEIEEMIKQALSAKPEADSVEDLLNEIYRQKRHQ
jgi:Holliday junction DNA helicase RuvA